MEDSIREGCSQSGWNGAVCCAFPAKCPPLERALPGAFPVGNLVRLVILCGLVTAFLAPSALAAEQDPGTGERQQGEVQPLADLRTSELSAPKPPRILFEDGQLTIIAENSLLSDILSVLRERTGADIELPVSATGNRMWVRLGPGPAHRVLAQLFGNTDFDYVIQASDTDADLIQSILLTQRRKTPPTNGLRTAGGQPLPQTNRRVSPPVKPDEAEVAEEVKPAAAETSQEAAPVPPVAASTDQAPAAVDKLQPPPEVVADNSNGTSPRRQEQMIQQLQAMYQQRREQMQATKNP